MSSQERKESRLLKEIASLTEKYDFNEAQINERGFSEQAFANENKAVEDINDLVLKERELMELYKKAEKKTERDMADYASDQVELEGGIISELAKLDKALRAIESELRRLWPGNSAVRR